MTKTIEEIRTFYPDNDPEVARIMDECTWEYTYGWQRKLTLHENILAHKDMGLNKWFLDLPLEIKESLNLFSNESNIFIHEEYWCQFQDLEENHNERELQPFEHGYEEQQERLNSNVIKLKDYKPDDRKE